MEKRERLLQSKSEQIGIERGAMGQDRTALVIYAGD